VALDQSASLDAGVRSVAPSDRAPEVRGHVDSVVMLLRDASDSAAAVSWARLFVRALRVVLVTRSELKADERLPTTDDGMIRVTLPAAPPVEQCNYLNRALRRFGLIRPLLWLEDPQQAVWFCSSYAPLKVIALWGRAADAFHQSLSHADAIVIAPDRSCPDELLQPLKGRAWVLPTEATEAHVTEFNRLTAEAIANRPVAGSRLNLAILYDHNSTSTNTHREHLTSFSRYSRHRVFYVPASTSHPNPPLEMDLSVFDVVVLHYSIRLCLNTLLPVYARAVDSFGGLKLCFIQDEYDYTEIERQALERLGVHVVFTCVPSAYRERVYPTDRFPYVEFVQVLTGYVPLNLETPGRHKPFKDRKFFIGYRGRALPSWYGDLGREKLLIGQRVREACEGRGIPVDIEWDDDHRIYGERWYEFMRECRATLGSESGSNVFDDHGDIRRAIQGDLQKEPELAYETLHSRYMAEHDGSVRMNQISPRVFEAIALRTALVLFEGEYSGVISPGVHYIPLKKDLSNLDEVLERLADDEYLERLTSRAWTDVVGSGRYSYRAFIDLVDKAIDRQSYRGTGTSILTAVVAAHGADEREWQWRPMDQALATFSAFTSEIIDFDQRPAPPVARDPLIPVDPLQALKWNIADLLHRHTPLYVVGKAAFRTFRFVLRPLRRGGRAVSGLFHQAEKQDAGPASKLPDVRP